LAGGASPGVFPPGGGAAGGGAPAGAKPWALVLDHAPQKLDLLL
jgi:hypothetical protein